MNFLVKKIADESIVQTGNITIENPSRDIDPARVTFAKEWQSSSYLLLKDDISLKEYACDPNEPECKINLQIIPQLD